MNHSSCRLCFTDILTLCLRAAFFICRFFLLWNPKVTKAVYERLELWKWLLPRMRYIQYNAHMSETSHASWCQTSVFTGLKKSFKHTAMTLKFDVKTFLFLALQPLSSESHVEVLMAERSGFKSVVNKHLKNLHAFLIIFISSCGNCKHCSANSRSLSFIATSYHRQRCSKTSIYRQIFYVRSVLKITEVFPPGVD